MTGKLRKAGRSVIMAVLLRFLILALPLAVLVLALAPVAAELAGAAPQTGPLALHGVARPIPLDLRTRALALGFEAFALIAFYLLVEGRTASRLLDGAVAGFAAWTFRGPLLVLAVAELTRLPTAPFWQLARISLVALPLAGIAIGLVARLTRPPR